MQRLCPLSFQRVHRVSAAGTHSRAPLLFIFRTQVQLWKEYSAAHLHGFDGADCIRSFDWNWFSIAEKLRTARDATSGGLARALRPLRGHGGPAHQRLLWPV